MKQQLIIFLILFSCLISCANQNADNRNQKIGNNISFAHDSLIIKLANMKTDTLDCSANIYWQIIGKGKSIIPNLIESLTDTTQTNIYHGCKTEKLNIGELSYFALEEIVGFPTFVVTKIQFDVIQIKDEWHCWNFYNYLFDNRNKKEYQEKVKAFYEKSQFESVGYPDSLLTECMKENLIKGKYKWKN